MYLSRLTLDARSREVRRDVAFAYELHRSILTGFPGRDHGGPGRVLFRIEPERTPGTAVVLVQSDTEPDWTSLQSRDHYLVDVAVKKFDIAVRDGQHLRFRLRANPIVKREGSRHALTGDEDQRGWLARKGEAGGFRPVQVAVRRAVRTVSRRPAATGTRGPQVHHAVDYEGLIEVTDAARLAASVRRGIGPAKGYGFGLLSLARA